MESTVENDVQELLAAMVRSLVDAPDEVEIQPFADDTGTTFRVLASSNEIGKIIGMHGRTARALRTIISANASRLKRRFTVDIVDKTRI